MEARSNERSRRPLAVDLFAGAGGFALGIEQAGYDVVAALEYDAIHAAVHAFNFPDTAVVCADARTVEIQALTAAAEQGRRDHGHAGPWNGEIDLVFGGPPCQGFSVVGCRRADDARNELSFAFARLVAELRPKAFVLENVPGMPSVAGPRDRPLLPQVIAKLRRAGYRVARPHVLNAADFGVPQDRRRLLVMGVRSDIADGPPAPPKPTVNPVAKRPSPSEARNKGRHGLPEGPTVADALDDVPDLDAFAELADSDHVMLSRLQAQCGRDVASRYAKLMREPWRDPHDLSAPRLFDRDALTSSHRTTHAEHVATRFAATACGSLEPVSRFYRLHPDGLSATLRAGTGYDRGSFNAPRPIHHRYARVISVREAARLHSIPDWFRLHWTKWHGFRQVGNAVPPYLSRAIAAAIRDHLALATVPARPAGQSSPELLHFTMSQAADYFGVPIDSVPHHGLRVRAGRNPAATHRRGSRSTPPSHGVAREPPRHT